MLYQREDGCRAWLASARLSPETARTLIEDFGSAEAVYDQTRRDRGKALGEHLKPARIQQLLEASAPEAMHEMMVAMRDHDIRIMAWEDYLYSDALRSIAQPPAFLFYRGNAARLGERCLTVVGARSASPKGLAATESICEELSCSGVTVVSGLAPGIDTAAHEGSLHGGTPGIGVMACGLDVDYPASSRALKESLLDAGGLLIGEEPVGMRVAQGSFPRRNRILSGISRGVVLMEARIRSGSMNTVHHALDQGREVFAWPGEPGSPYAEGAHQLLREGARYFTSAGDILEDMGWDTAPVQPREKPSPILELKPEMHMVLTILHRGEKSMDELCQETGMDAGELMGTLTLLQMCGQIKALPGKIYCIV